MIIANLPALIVVLPLLAAVIAPFTGRRQGPWWIAMLASITVWLGTIQLLNQVQRFGVISYAMGGWQPPWGIEYRIDLLNVYVLIVISSIVMVVTAYARLSVAKEIAADRIRFFYSAYLLCITGLLGITVTGDAFNLYVLLEVSSLATYVLVALGSNRAALKASFNYLILGTIGATLLLIGIGHLYMATGTLNMADLSIRLSAMADNRTVQSGFAFIVVGASIKLALFPLHTWLPGAYSHAPSTVTALLGATATKVGAYVLLRFLFSVFGVEFSFSNLRFDIVLITVSSLAVIYGSLRAIQQGNVKSLLAYSSIGQIGYIGIGFSLASVTGLTAGILHLFNHALMKGGLFLCLGCLVYRLGTVELKQIAGFGRRLPWTFIAFVIGCLSLIGIPGTVGFISKWYLVLAAAEQQQWHIVAVIVLGSLLAIVYCWRVIETAYFEPPSSRISKQKEAPLGLLAPTWVLIAANIYFGLDTRLTVGIARDAARWLLGVTS